MLSRKAKKQVHPQIIASLSEHFTSKELITLSKFGTIVDVAPDRTLTSLSDSSRQAMLVIDGRVKVRRGDSIFIVDSGAFFGAVDPKDRTAPSTSSVSLEQSSVLVFSARDFDAVLHLAPSLKSVISAANEPRPEKVIDLTDHKPTNSVATHPLPSAA